MNQDTGNAAASARLFLKIQLEQIIVNVNGHYSSEQAQLLAQVLEHNEW